MERTWTLSPADQELVDRISKERQARNERARVRDARIGPRDSVEYHRMGFAGELAFCRMHDIPPDLDTTPRKGSSDCRLNGESVDVKTTDYIDGRLVVKTTKEAMASAWYALMIMDWPTFRFIGMVRAADLFKPEYLRDHGYGVTYSMDQWAVAEISRVREER